MKITQKSLSDKALEKRDYRDWIVIRVDGEKHLSFLDGDAEDANLGRDFNDCFKIVDLLKKAFEAGKNGETLEVEEIEVDDINEL